MPSRLTLQPGFGIQGQGFRIRGSGLEGSECRVQGLGSRFNFRGFGGDYLVRTDAPSTAIAHAVRFTCLLQSDLEISRFRVPGPGFKVQGFGFRD